VHAARGASIFQVTDGFRRNVRILAACGWVGSMTKANYTAVCCCKCNHVDDGDNRLESHVTTIAAIAPKTIEPENTYTEKSWMTSECIAQ
jgi:hypothetical protein